jgi:hypothetical protein
MALMEIVDVMKNCCAHTSFKIFGNMFFVVLLLLLQFCVFSFFFWDALIAVLLHDTKCVTLLYKDKLQKKRKKIMFWLSMYIAAISHSHSSGNEHVTFSNYQVTNMNVILSIYTLTTMLLTLLSVDARMCWVFVWIMIRMRFCAQ